MGFDEKVWKAISRVPRGKVTTYSQIARAIGSPKSMRAVGNACNKNPHSPKIPCHRVVKSDGSLGSYAHGSAKKVRLLRAEGIRIKNNRIVGFNEVLVNAKRL